MKEQILDQLKMFVWAKDKSFRYLYCNEMYAEAAGVDSPSQMIGKSDDDMPWRNLADYFKAGDHGVLQGHTRLNSAESSDTLTGITDILVSENQLLDKSGNCIGIIGSFIDITGQQLVKKSGHYDKEKDRFYLGEDEFKNVYLSGRELQVFKRLLLGYTSRQIAEIAGMSPKTVESYIERIKLKLQVKTKGEIIATAIQVGLTHVLY